MDTGIISINQYKEKKLKQVDLSANIMYLYNIKLYENMKPARTYYVNIYPLRPVYSVIYFKHKHSFKPLPNKKTQFAYNKFKRTISFFLLRNTLLIIPLVALRWLIAPESIEGSTTEAPILNS